MKKIKQLLCFLEFHFWHRTGDTRKCTWCNKTEILTGIEPGPMREQSEIWEELEN